MNFIDYLKEENIVSSETIDSVLHKQNDLLPSLKVIAEEASVLDKIDLSGFSGDLENDYQLEQYLIEKGLLGEEDKKAIVSMFSMKTPSVPFLLVKEKILEKDVILEAKKKYLEVKTSMGEESVSENVLDLGLLDSMVGHCADVSGNLQDKIDTTMSVAEEEGELAISGVEEKREFSGLNFTKEYIELFDSGVYSDLMASISKLKKDFSEISTQGMNAKFGDIYNKLHLLYGSARLANLSLSSRLIGVWENVINDLRLSGKPLKDSEFFITFEKSMMILNAIKLLLLRNEKESMFLAKKQNKDKYLNYYKMAMSYEKGKK